METIANAKNNLPQLVRRVEMGDPLVLTRHGKPVAVLQSYEAYQHIQNTYIKPKPAPDWWDGVLAWRAQLPADFQGMTEEELAAGRRSDLVEDPAWVKDFL